MNNVEIARRIRHILYNSVEWYKDGSVDFATCHAETINSLTELLLDILNAPKLN